MNAWLIAALALLPGFLACAWLILRGTIGDAIVGLEMVSTLATLELVLLAQGINQAPFFELALVLAFLSFAGSLVFLRYLGRWI